MADAMDPKRVEQILRVDTNSLLTIIRDLEAKLSDYHRQDKMPPWAEALVMRLDQVEQKVVLNDRPGSSGSGVGGPVSGLTMNDLSNDERMLVKVRAALDSQMSTTRLSMESRMTALSFEIERMHKLLNIRPTTSEFQHVVSSVNEVQRKMLESVDDLTKNVTAIVQEKVTKEMDDLLQQLRASEENHRLNNQLTMQKIEALSADIQSLVGGDNSTVEAVVSRVQGEFYSLKEQFFATKAKTEAEMTGVQYAMTEMRFGQDMTRDMLNDFKLITTNNVARMEESVRLMDETVKKTVQDLDERGQQTLDSAMEAKEAVKQLQSQYDYDLGKLRHASKTASDGLTDMANRLQEIEGYVKPQMAMDLNAMVSRQEETLKETATKMKDLDEKMEAVTSRMVKMSKSVTTIQEDLSVRIPEQFSRLGDRIDRMAEEQRTQEDNLRLVEGVLKQAQEKIGELLELVREVEVLKELQSTSEQTMMRVQNNVSVLTDSNADHEARLAGIAESLSKSEEGVARVIDEMRESLFDLIMEKQAEIDADVKNLRENLEIMSAVNDGTVRTVTTPAVASGVATDRAIMSRGAARGASANTRVGTAPSGTTSADGMPVVPQGAVHMPQNFSRRGQSGGGATGTLTTGPGRDSRLPSAGVTIGQGEGLGATSLGLSLVGFGLSAEDQRAVNQHHAQLMATLCESYEDIAVRKTNVPALPSTMCEQITSSAQVMTAFISTYTDSELVQKAIRNLAYDAGELPAEEFNATERREAKIEEFVAETLSLVSQSHPQTGLIRLDAREKFTKQLKKALMLCMSKHDQVLLLGNSRLGRIKIPSCIACDRPLLDKVRLDTTSALGGVNGGGGNNNNFHAPGAFRDMFPQQPPSSSSSSPGRGQTRHQLLSASMDFDAQSSLPNLYPMKGRGASEFPLLMDAGSRSGSAGDAFVMRGGFKMPRPQQF
jgi:hypothetical protein